MSDFFPTNASSTRWLTEEVFKLIDLVQRDEAIYNPRHKYYFCRPYVENFWREVDQKLDKNPGASLAKWTNLRISFRREFTNYLEEKVPPCWSYFDRMFFLHPYLRKKHQVSKPGEQSLQETIAQINELSNRLERHSVERASKSDSNLQHTASGSLPQLNSADNYFDFYDDPEPNNSEIDDIIEDEQHHHHDTVQYPQVILDSSDSQHKIKSENEDEAQEDDFETENEDRHENLHAIDGDEDLVRNVTTTTSGNVRLGKRTHHSQQQLRLEHLNRIQTRSYQEDLRAKRPRSQERLLVNPTTISLPAISNVNSINPGAGSLQRSNTNVSFVRPTVSKLSDSTCNVNNGILDPNTSSSNSVSASTALQPQTSRYYSQRFESAASSSSMNNNGVSTFANNLQSTRQLQSPTTATVPTPHLELCDCKTDPDAMFLMSLLPDIQKLNGRDRGKIKIAFQNILQDYLYPD